MLLVSSLFYRVVYIELICVETLTEGGFHKTSTRPSQSLIVLVLILPLNSDVDATKLLLFQFTVKGHSSSLLYSTTVKILYCMSYQVETAETKLYISTC